MLDLFLLSCSFIGIYAGAKDRADHSFDSVEMIADWLTLGTVEMAKGAFNPEEAWSNEHWMNSLGMATLITGPLESQLLKPSTGVGIPKLPNPPSPKDISSPRGLENLNKNPVMITPEGLRIKFDEVHTDVKPSTKTPVQEYFNKEMEQFCKGGEGIEGTGEGQRLIPGSPGVITGGNSTKLGKNMLEE